MAVTPAAGTDVCRPGSDREQTTISYETMAAEQRSTFGYTARPEMFRAALT
jgi:hypothetical protein